MNSPDELRRVVRSIEKSYGYSIESILCLKTDGANQKVEVAKFQSVDQFDAGFNDAIFSDTMTLKLDMPNLSKEFLIDIQAKQITIVTTEEKPDDIPWKYYRVDDSITVKRDMKTENFYRLEPETHEWTRIPTMIGFMNDGTFEFDEITEEMALSEIYD